MEKMKMPAWVKMTESELKETISELSLKHPPTKVGMILRDQYGIPTTKVYGKKLKAYYDELGIDRNEDLENAQKKVERLKEHLASNVTDRKAKHKLQRAQARENIVKRCFGLAKVRKK